MFGGGDDFRRHLRPGPHDQTIGVLDFLEKFLLGELGLHNHRKARLLKQLDPLFRQAIANQDFHCRGALPEDGSIWLYAFPIKIS